METDPKETTHLASAAGSCWTPGDGEEERKVARSIWLELTVDSIVGRQRHSIDGPRSICRQSADGRRRRRRRCLL